MFQAGSYPIPFLFPKYLAVSLYLNVMPPLLEVSIVNVPMENRKKKKKKKKTEKKKNKKKTRTYLWCLTLSP